MNSMFYDASSFNQPLSSWDIAAVTDLSNMLSGAAAFRQDLCPWARRLHPNADTLNVFRGTNCPQEQDDDMEFFLSRTTSFCFSCPAQAGGNDANSTNNSTGTIGDLEEQELAPTPAPTRQDLYGVILGREDLLTLQNALVEASMIETLSRQQGAVHT
jgi:surface protein